MDPLERGDLEAALARAAKSGDWAAAKALGEELGPRAWGRRALMGESPEGLAFERALKAQGAPEPLDWIAKQGSDPQRRSRLEARLAQALAKGETPDAGGRAGAWLAASCASAPEREELASVSGVAGFDAGPWAREMAQRIRSGEASRAWSQSDHFWRLLEKSLSTQSGEDLFSALGRARMARPFKASSAGAVQACKRMMSGLSAPKALALLAASSCQTKEDWDEFELACGSEAGDAWAAMEGLGFQEGDGWKALAADAAGAPLSEGFDALGVGTNWGGELSRGSRDLGIGSAWTHALEACAQSAAPALEDPRVAGALDWIAKKVPATAAAKAAPGLAARGDLSRLSASEVLEALSRLSQAHSASLEAAARSAAARLWELRETPGQDSARGKGRHREESTPLREAALELWQANAPKAFEAFLAELERLAGSKAGLSTLSGFPQALRWARATPGAAGNVVALARAFGPGSLDDRGLSPWMDSDGEGSDALHTVAQACATGARLALIESGGGSGPAPARWADWEALKAADLSATRWMGGQGATAAEQGWESAQEALALLGRLIEAGAKSARPPDPEEGPGAFRNAWACFAEGWPEEVASWAASGWLAGEAKAKLASDVCSWLSPQGRSLVAKAAPKAFVEAAGQASRGALGSEEGDGALARASREAAKALSPKDPEALCAAAMCACAVGLAGAVSRWDGQQRRSAERAATGLAEYLPLASATARRRWEGEGRGLRGIDLGSRAARAALQLKASGLIEGPLAASMSEWEGATLDPSSPWTAGVLGGLFEESAWELADGRSNPQLWLQAFEWSKKSGAGLGREPGGASALELAVDARARKMQKPSERNDDPDSRAGAARTFGEQAIQALVAMGADPSDPQAGEGWDALALCTRLERADSPSSAMKALLASPKANPGRGAMWARVARGKANFSTKLEDTLLARAREHCELEALALLASKPLGSSERELSRALMESPKAREAAPDLLGKMCEMGASSDACLKAALAMEAAGLAPSEASRLAMGEAAAKELDNGSPWGLEASWTRWAKAGAASPKLSKELVGEAIWQSWEAMGFKTAPALGELCCAVALWQVEGAGRQASVGGQRAAMFALAAVGLPKHLAGGRVGAAMSRVWDALDRSGALAFAKREVGEAKMALLEACALSGSLASTQAAPARGPRL